MNYIASQRAEWETRRDIAFGAISAVYAAVGSPFEHPVRMFKVVNATDADIDITDDITQNKDIILAGSSFIYDLVSNSTSVAGNFNFNKGKQIYVKGTPTSGTLYVVIIYAAGPGE